MAEPIRCGACSEALNAGAKFCPRCGRSVDERGQVIEPSGPPPGYVSAKVKVTPVAWGLLAALAAGPLLITLGLIFSAHWLLYAGIAVVVGVVLFLIFGSMN